MAKKISRIGQIVPTDLHQEMERSYLEYAMSVIVGRALPDVRDGLKPVHRRILFAMYELGLTPDRPYRKCARVVGDVLGKYHPHGDQAVYDALVRMVQDFSSRYPLLAGHGNFGSVDNDPAAAMRYTETRLAPIAMDAMLEDISEAIVDFTDNFDSSQQEPTVVPAQLPLLLLNGCSGIAVGMATNIPPHNLGEVVDGLIGLINKPLMSDAELFKLIPGPDFPTGGEILDSKGILQAYQTGRGLIPVRGVSHIETIKGEKKRSHNRTAIVVTELPFQVNKASWIEKIASLVNAGKLDGISDLRDESDRTGMRVVIELKRDVKPKAILQKLYRMTPLQSNFGMISLALAANQPIQMSLRRLLQEFLQFREDTLIRQYDHELADANRRLEVLDGLRIGLENLDVLIEILRVAPDGNTAKTQLQERLGISVAQGDAILGMPMRRITGLEQEKLQQERQALAERIQTLKTLLGDRHERLKAMKKELRGLKKKFGDPRRTRIIDGMPTTITPIAVKPKPDPGSVDSDPNQDESVSSQLPASPPTPTSETPSSTPPSTTAPPLTLDQETVHPDGDSTLFSPAPQNPSSPVASDNTSRPAADPATQDSTANPSSSPKNDLALFTPQAPPENAVLSLTLDNEIAWHKERLTPEGSPLDHSPIVRQIPLQKQKTLVAIADNGKAYTLAVQDIPPLKLARVKLLDLLPKSAQRDVENVVYLNFPPTDPVDLLLLSTQGRLKRVTAAELEDLGSRGLSLIQLRDGARLRFCQWIRRDQPQQNLVVATSRGRLLRFPLTAETLPLSGRTSQGQSILRLRPQEKLIGLLALPAQDSVLLLTQFGYGKRLPISTVRCGNFGDLGTTITQFTDPQDQLLVMLVATDSPIKVITTQGSIEAISAEQFQDWGKDGAGDLLTSTKIINFLQPQ